MVDITITNQIFGGLSEHLSRKNIRQPNYSLPGYFSQLFEK